RSFGGVRALDGVTISVAEGERRAVIGPNGAGKTTLFNVLTGEIRASGGAVRVAGQDVTRLRPWQRARLGVARMYQRNELFAPLSARENVVLAIASRSSPYRFGGALRAEQAAADALLDRVGLHGRETSPAGALSHGERRQLELAVALGRQPR